MQVKPNLSESMVSPWMGDCSTLHIYGLNKPTLFFTVDKVELQYTDAESNPAIPQCLHVPVGWPTTGNQRSIIKKVDGMNDFIFRYILTWFIFLKKIRLFFTKINFKRLINDFDRHTVIRVAQ